MKKDDFDLDNLGPEEEHLSEEQFDMIKEQIQKITQTLKDEDNQVTILKNKLFNILKKKPTYNQVEF